MDTWIGSEVGRYTQVTVSDCTPDTTRCFVQRGTNVTITIDFTINRPVKTVTSVVVGEALGAQGEIPFPDSNACTDPHSGISCPLSGLVWDTLNLKNQPEYPTKLSLRKKFFRHGPLIVSYRECFAVSRTLLRLHE
ncbi:hypothetical protein PV325_009069 [Microctonus aethiopoides]|nr:hypothetical protein PV325_009069 [Microctonus aethiopoides]